MRRATKKIGKSNLIPYVENEHAQQRHLRRLAINFLYLEPFKERLISKGYTFLLKEEEHWIFYNSKTYYEWWPAKAHLVKNRKYRHAIHIHDVEQVIFFLFGETLF